VASEVQALTDEMPQARHVWVPDAYTGCESVSGLTGRTVIEPRSDPEPGARGLPAELRGSRR
jgi:hypothetical protein